MLVTCPVAEIKYPDKTSLRKEKVILAFHLWVQSVRGRTDMRQGGKAWQWEPVAAGHSAATDMEQRAMNSSAEVTLSFLFSLRPQPQ